MKKEKLWCLLVLWAGIGWQATAQDCERQFISDLKKECAALTPKYIRGVARAKSKQKERPDIPKKKDLIPNQNVFFVSAIFSISATEPVEKPFFCCLDAHDVNNMGQSFAYLPVGDTLYSVRESRESIFQSAKYYIEPTSYREDQRLVEAMKKYRPDVAFYVNYLKRDQYTFFILGDQVKIFDADTDRLEDIRTDHPVIQRQLKFSGYIPR